MRLIMMLFAISFFCSVDAAQPITDTVILEGREWAQPDIFSDLSWNEVNVVCPNIVCDEGELYGY